MTEHGMAQFNTITVVARVGPDHCPKNIALMQKVFSSDELEAVPRRGS